MRYEKDLTRHTAEERAEFGRAAIREFRKGNTLVGYCLQAASDGIYPVKRLTWRQRLFSKVLGRTHNEPQ
jgi:hypothetical protein